MTVSDPSARIYLVAGLEATVGATRYDIIRWYSETDNATHGKAGGIIYVYVDKDCTITRAAKSWTETDGGGQPINMSFAAVNLPLEKGWNLVQRDNSGEITDTYTISLKIANTDVPWTWADAMM